MDILQELSWRGLIHQVTDEKALAEQLKQPTTLYVGFDPTADSLHIGNLLPILTLRRFQLAGHHPIALVGGATGLIGDPSGRSTERTLNEVETVAAWSARIRAQLERFLDFDGVPNPAVIVNNYDWTHSLDVISFLRDICKSFSLNYMLAKESVDSRLERGISFTEFSYMILQANDFWNLFQSRGCRLQIGGSDQWGNITAGLELVRRQSGQTVYGLTMPLVTKADGTKFGKSEGGAIWLDPKKTTPYQFYQFWLNTDDRDVVQYLKYFTFLSQAEIQALADEVASNPGARAAQRALAREVTTLVHGAGEAERAEQVSHALFRGNLKELTGSEIADALQGVPSIRKSKEETVSLVSVLVELGACPSNRQAREDIRNGAISVNGDKQTDIEANISAADGIEGQYVVIRRGKKSYFLVHFA
ncbi:tyrosine--tRNA ligase 1 [Alicyclobacillus contaminans]|uniref:tyrosine--tRNA ligase n=1 Tax=Alicyclobacillus contaminans TaxID=392016 RepID=UPI000420F397|nr:tyrosine--tRNA ligase [Alicyclobacillus contaminans]GMA51915.1 tyrosine--tRNA ligase 1 [Alicyclobacillus contaminans]